MKEIYRFRAANHRWTCRVGSVMLVRVSTPTPVDRAAFHARLPGYAPTPLHDLPALADRLGVDRLLVKDESARLGLPAFKILGASWGVYRALLDRLGPRLAAEPWDDLADFARRLGTLGPAGAVRLLAATAGNHGRAVARTAGWLGLPAEILLPATASARMVVAAGSEGATVRRVDGDYDAAVAAAAELAAADPRYLLVQDTTWPGYERIPGWIVDGYATLFEEIDRQLADRGQPAPDGVVVPVGVGSLLSAAVRHYRVGAPVVPAVRRPALVAVEPVTAACLLASLRAGHPVTVPTGVTAMEGLNAGSVSPAAWPLLCDQVTEAVAVTDAQAEAAVRELAAAGVPAGPCGAATLAGLSAVLSAPDGHAARERLGLAAGGTVVLVCTDGRG